MKWLQSGVAKSGNLWLYNILQCIAREAGLPQKSFIRHQAIHAIARDWPLSFPGQADIDTLSINPGRCLYRISGIFNMPIEDLDAYVAQTSHVWTQSYFSKMSRAVFPKFDRVVYIVRDPRDAAISMSRFSFTPYRQQFFTHGIPTPEAFLEANLLETLAAWVRHVAGHLAHQEELGIHVVFYERLLEDFDRELETLLRYLGVELGARALEKVRNEVRFENMKDRNPQHVRKGRWGEWTEVFTPAQARLGRTVAGRLLGLLGYPLDKAEFAAGAGRLPRLPEGARPGAFEAVLADLERKMLVEKTFRSLRTWIRPEAPRLRLDPAEAE
jgi:aryl sulfotransferase